MMVAPGVTKPHQRCSQPVSLLDIYPTLVELCDLRRKPDLMGRSLLPLLKNPVADWERPALTTHGKDNHSLRTERWRYIRYSDGPEELYDHDNDELEWTNLAGDPKYAELKKGLIRWLPKENVPEVKAKRGRRRPNADD